MGYSFTNIQIRNTGEEIDCDRLVSVLTEGKRLRRVDKAEKQISSSRSSPAGTADG